MFFRRLLCLWVIVSFVSTLIVPSQTLFAQTVLDLPAVGTMVSVSPSFEPTLIRGLTVHQDNPFLFDFIVDPGQSKLSKQDLKDESGRMIKYFFAALTIPDKDIWVNLSPYEKDRMVPASLGVTAMGRDLLAQDYMLKQLTASLIYPQKALGKTFWNKVYAKAKETYGTTQIPVNTFNKVWIVPQRVGVYEHGQTAFIVSGHLKVMLEEDYLSLAKHNAVNSAKAGIHSVGSQIIRQIILPEIEKEINEGKNFSTLRQIFYAQALAVWFKRNLKQALLNRVYANKGTVKGIDQNDNATNEAIYHQYLRAYKKGVFNYIKEDKIPYSFDPNTGDQRTIARKYFSGGYFGNEAMLSFIPASLPEVERVAARNGLYRETVVAETKEADAEVLARNAAVALEPANSEDDAMISDFLAFFNDYQNLKHIHELSVFGLGVGLGYGDWLDEKAKKAKTLKDKLKYYRRLHLSVAEYPIRSILPTAAIGFLTTGIAMTIKAGLTPFSMPWLMGMQLGGGFEFAEGISNYRPYVKQKYLAAKAGNAKELERLESLDDNPSRKRFLGWDWKGYLAIVFLGATEITFPSGMTQDIQTYFQHYGTVAQIVFQFLPLAVGIAAGLGAGYLASDKRNQKLLKKQNAAIGVSDAEKDGNNLVENLRQTAVPARAGSDMDILKVLMEIGDSKSPLRSTGIYKPILEILRGDKSIDDTLTEFTVESRAERRAFFIAAWLTVKRELSPQAIWPIYGYLNNRVQNLGGEFYARKHSIKILTESTRNSQIAEEIINEAVDMMDAAMRTSLDIVVPPEKVNELLINLYRIVNYKKVSFQLSNRRGKEIAFELGNTELNERNIENFKDFFSSHGGEFIGGAYDVKVSQLITKGTKGVISHWKEGRASIIALLKNYYTPDLESAPNVSFSPGPAHIPQEVLKERIKRAQEGLKFGFGLNSAAYVHPDFQKVHQEVKDRLRDLLNVPKDFEIFLLPSAMSMVFALIPRNFLHLKPRHTALYATGDVFSRRAAEFAEKVAEAADGGTIKITAAKIDGTLSILTPEQANDDSLSYIWIAENFTSGGLGFSKWPKTKAPLFIDATSIAGGKIYSPEDYKNVGGIIFGAQKFLGASGGLTVAVIRNDLIKEGMAFRGTAPVEDFSFWKKYPTLVTPNVGGELDMLDILKFYEKYGGIRVQEARAIERSSILYTVIDRSNGFYKGFIQDPNERSIANVVFHMRDPQLTAEFKREGQKRGLHFMSGFSSTAGGPAGESLRISMYSGISIKDTLRLAEFMRDFQAEHGPAKEDTAMVSRGDFVQTLQHELGFVDRDILIHESTALGSPVISMKLSVLKERFEDDSNSTVERSIFPQYLSLKFHIYGEDRPVRRVYISIGEFYSLLEPSNKAMTGNKNEMIGLRQMIQEISTNLRRSDVAIDRRELAATMVIKIAGAPIYQVFLKTNDRGSYIVSADVWNYNGAIHLAGPFVFLNKVPFQASGEAILSELLDSADGAMAGRKVRISQQSSSRSDKAALTINPTGGIDLSQQDAALQVTKDANGGVKVSVDPALIARIEREGMTEVDPVIINMQPADIESLFGVKAAI